MSWSSSNIVMFCVEGHVKRALGPFHDSHFLPVEEYCRVKSKYFFVDACVKKARGAFTFCCPWKKSVVYNICKVSP